MEVLAVCHRVLRLVVPASSHRPERSKSRIHRLTEPLHHEEISDEDLLGLSAITRLDRGLSLWSRSRHPVKDFRLRVSLSLHQRASLNRKPVQGGRLRDVLFEYQPEALATFHLPERRLHLLFEGWGRDLRYEIIKSCH
jgi:hypothetical protein